METRHKWMLIIGIAICLAVIYSYCEAGSESNSNSLSELEQLVMAPYKLAVYTQPSGGEKYEIGLVNPIDLENQHIFARIQWDTAGIRLKPFREDLGKWILIPYSNIRYIKALKYME